MDICNAVTKFEPSHLASEQLDSFVSSYDTSPLVASRDDFSLNTSKRTLVRGIPGFGRAFSTIIVVGLNSLCKKSNGGI